MTTTLFEQLTEQARTMWGAAVDYQPVANQAVMASELLVQAAGVGWGERVLDVAAGTGNTALVAARRGAKVTATDLGAVGLERAVRRADAEGLVLDTEVADAQRLPYDDASFDVVLSTFGVMYAPDQQRAADELLRVCRPGGRIGLVSWCPTGTMEDLQQTTAQFRPPSPPGMAAPHLWGTEDHYTTLFGDRIRITTSAVLTQDAFAASSKAQAATLLMHLPPWRMLHGRLDSESQTALAAAIEAAYERSNQATDGTMHIGTQYLQIVATVV